MKRIVVLGSTGSIGVQTLDIVRQHSDRLQVVGLAAYRNADLISAQAKEFGAKQIALSDERAAKAAGIPGGLDAVIAIAAMDEVDLVVIAVAGVIGLMPTIAAIQAGKNVALASKEVLVSAGEVVMPLVRKHGVTMTPIDSEHSALFQCMQGYTTDQVSKLIITGSGGPFRGKGREDLKKVTTEEALNHPTWRMGGKITVDSATLMNKGLEIIEARWLFDVAPSQVDVVIHPQSVVHSFVKFKDGSVLGQFGWPDMRLAIQYALLWPERKPNDLKPWDPTDTPTLTFEKPDEKTFRSLYLARQALKTGGTMPCAMNAANEVAATAFLDGTCGFLQIAETVEEVMVRHAPGRPNLENLIETDKWARRTAQSLLDRKR
ncbi:MAG TPA: 1-deoxy-D-xylulose-5-phosphate reductoisomerase [Fimbriimonadaceae bacterium]|nr:1-deoxy-D-xylulose-5-phosphate reductoisomerase [Fimbriimonadaceae bacterium]